MNERRSKMRIFRDMIYTIIKKGGKAKPTHIMYGANLSHDRLKSYLEFLMQKGFIEEINNNGRIYYIVSDKGQKFVNEFEKIEELSNAFGISI
jgi:predicted transcriptional regulator